MRRPDTFSCVAPLASGGAGTAVRVRISLEGEGHLVLSRENERFYPLLLQRDLCFFVEHFIWAME